MFFYGGQAETTVFYLKSIDMTWHYFWNKIEHPWVSSPGFSPILDDHLTINQGTPVRLKNDKSNKNGGTRVNITSVSYIMQPKKNYSLESPLWLIYLAAGPFQSSNINPHHESICNEETLTQHWPWLCVEKALCSHLDSGQEHSC